MCSFDLLRILRVEGFLLTKNGEAVGQVTGGQVPHLLVFLICILLKKK